MHKALAFLTILCAQRTTALKLAVLLLSAFCAGWLCSRSALPAAPSVIRRAAS